MREGDRHTTDARYAQQTRATFTHSAVGITIGVTVRCFVVTGRDKGVCVYGSVAQGAARGAVSGLWLEGRVCSMLTVMLVETWISQIRV